MVVDGIWSLIGSANWDPRSLRLNFEYNIECYDAEFGRQRADETLGFGGAVVVVVALVAEQGLVAPDRFTVLAPIASQRPTRQLLAGIPLALTDVQHAAGGELTLETKQ